MTWNNDPETFEKQTHDKMNRNTAWGTIQPSPTLDFVSALAQCLKRIFFAISKILICPFLKGLFTYSLFLNEVAVLVQLSVSDFGWEQDNVL